MLHLDDTRPDPEQIERAINLREAVVLSILVHVGLIALMLWLPTLPFVQELLATPPEAQAVPVTPPRQQPEPSQRFVMVEPRIDREAVRRLNRPAPLSDLDREARSRERNPNATNTFNLKNVDGTGYVTLSMSPEDWDWPSKLKRTYKAVDLFLEHPFDGKWEARIDYTWSKSQGNTEGPANTDTGQGSDEHDSGISLSQNWDAAEIMAFADGYLANDRRHQLKARASYAVTPEWMVSGNLTVLSGSPISCFDYYSPDGRDLEDPIGYYASYHTCFGEASPPGKTYTPWTHRLDLGLTYRPAMFDSKLALSVNVFNVLNETHPTYYNSVVGDYHAPPYEVSNTYNMPLTYATPRYVMFTASYDW